MHDVDVFSCQQVVVVFVPVDAERLGECVELLPVGPCGSDEFGLRIGTTFFITHLLDLIERNRSSVLRNSFPGPVTPRASTQNFLCTNLRTRRSLYLEREFQRDLFHTGKNLSEIQVRKTVYLFEGSDCIARALAIIPFGVDTQGRFVMSSEAQAVSANAAFWEETYSRNFQKLCSRACRKLTRGRMAEAEDIVSETFVKVMLTKGDASDISHPLQYLWTAIQRAWFSQQARRDVVNTEQLEDMTVKTLEKLASVKLEPKVLETLEREESLHALMCTFGPMSLQEKRWSECVSRVIHSVKSPLS